MKNLRIRVQVLTPIEIPNYPIHLDGLLYWSIIDHTDWDKDTALSYLDSAIAKQNGIYKASAMIFTRSVDTPLIACETAHPTTINWNEFGLLLSKKIGTIITKTGYYRKRMTKRNAISVGYIEFYAVGDSYKIQHLLELAGFIGLSNKQGFGEIGEILIEEIAQDHSFFFENGLVARNLPIEMLPSDYKGVQQLLPTTPPYSTTRKILSVFPEFTVITY